MHQICNTKKHIYWSGFFSIKLVGTVFENRRDVLLLPVLFISNLKGCSKISI